MLIKCIYRSNLILKKKNPQHMSTVYKAFTKIVYVIYAFWQSAH